MQLATFKITAEKIKNWKPINTPTSTLTDCAINVLKFFDIINSNDAKNLASLKNTLKATTWDAEIIHYLNKKHPQFDFASDRITTPFQAFIQVLNEIPSNSGIIALCGRASGEGHAVIIAKASNGQIQILDPQQNTRVVLLNTDHIQEWARRDKYDKVFTYYFQPTVLRQGTSTRKRQLSRSPSTRRRQLSRSPSRSRSLSRSPQTRKKKRVDKYQYFADDFNPVI